MCLAELDTADDKKKNLDTPISDIENAIVDEEEPIATLTAETEALQNAIKALDKQMAVATEQQRRWTQSLRSMAQTAPRSLRRMGFAKTA